MILSTSSTAGAAGNDKPQYLSDWWHQSVSVVGSYYTRFGPQIRNDTYLGYEAFVKKDWLDFYGYIDAPAFFGGNSMAKDIWNSGSPLFMEIKPRFSIDKLINIDPGFGPFKERHFANNYICDTGHNGSQEQSTRYMGPDTDIDIGLPMSLPLNVYAKYQWQNYGASSENEWDGYRFKMRYFVPLTGLWGDSLSYIGSINFDRGSDLDDDNSYGLNGKYARTSNSIISSHILASNYTHWHCSVMARYFHNDSQWADDVKLDFGDSDLSIHSTSWGGYLVAGYNFQLRIQLDSVRANRAFLFLPHVALHFARKIT